MRVISEEELRRWKSIGKPFREWKAYKAIGRIAGLTVQHSRSKTYLMYQGVDSDCVQRYFGFFKKTELAGVTGWAQVAVQRDPSIKRKRIPERIFLEYALKEVGVIYSDKKQTKAGRYFWEVKIIPAALAIGCYVYAFDAEKESFRRVTKAGNYPIEVWSEKQANQNRLVVSTKPLRRIL